MSYLKSFIAILQKAYAEFQSDNASQMAAALAYYAMFSIFPLLLLLISILGFVMSFWAGAPSARDAILDSVERAAGANLRATVDQTLSVVQSGAGTAAGVGLVTLLIGASGAFQQLDQAFNKIWGVKPAGLQQGIMALVISAIRDKLTSFLMVMSVGGLLILSLGLSVIVRPLLNLVKDVPVLSDLAPIASSYLITITLTTLVFAILFKFLPDVSIAWRDVFPAALLTAVLWELAKRVLTLYIGSSAFASAYGLVGAVLVLMAWIYFSSLLLFFGAEFSKAYARRPRPDVVLATTSSDVAHGPLADPQVLASVEKPVDRTSQIAGASLLLGAVAGVLATVLTLVLGVWQGYRALTRRLRQR